MFLPKGQSQTGMANAPHCQREGGSGGFSNSRSRPLSFYFARVCLKAAAAGSSFDAQSRPGPVPLLVVSPGKPPTRGGRCRRAWCNSGRPLAVCRVARPKNRPAGHGPHGATRRHAQTQEKSTQTSSNSRPSTLPTAKKATGSLGTPGGQQEQPEWHDHENRTSRRHRCRGLEAECACLTRPRCVW